MSSPSNFYEKTQKAKNSLKNLLKTSKGNIKSLIQKKTNETFHLPTRQIVSLSQLFSNLSEYGPPIDFYLEGCSSRESSPSLSFSADGVSKPTFSEIKDLLFLAFQIEISEDFQLLNQIIGDIDENNEKIGIIITNIKGKADIEVLGGIIRGNFPLESIKLMFFRSKPGIIVKVKRNSDFFRVLNLIGTNKAMKQVIGMDFKLLWFKEQVNRSENDYFKVILRNLPPNYTTNLIKTLVLDNYIDAEVKYIEDPMYYKGQISSIIILDSIYIAETLVKKLNNLLINNKYIIKVSFY